MYICERLGRYYVRTRVHVWLGFHVCTHISAVLFRVSCPDCTLHTHISHSHFTLTLHTHIAHSHCTLTFHTLHTHIAHSLFTLTLHTHIAHSLFTLTLHAHISHSHFQVHIAHSLFTLTFHTHIFTFMIKVLKLQGLTESQWQLAFEILQLQHFNHRSDCSVQCVNGSRKDCFQLCMWYLGKQFVCKLRAVPLCGGTSL